jgi:hypothetical protein
MFNNKDRSFRGDLELIINKIEKNEKFAFSRFGDGEMIIVNDQPINLLNKNTGEFRYIPNDLRYAKSRELLINSFTYQSKNYFIGISCPCCVGVSNHEYMATKSGISPTNLTWANLFVNSNYFYFMTRLFKKLKGEKVVLISNELSNTNNFPLNLYREYSVGRDSWLHNLSLVDEIKEFIQKEKLKDCYFLFCAGPLSNIACCELHKFNEENYYLDCGSIFDDMLGLGKTRGYLNGASTLKKTCIWSKK